MDDAERIPIDVGYDVAAEAPQSDSRATVREDGTIVIDILASQPCPAQPGTGDEIVVCVQADGDPHRTGDAPPPSPGPMEKLEEALTAKVGPLEITPFGVRLKF